MNMEKKENKISAIESYGVQKRDHTKMGILEDKDNDDYDD
jgi:hypothetical protein